ncbi:preprotein translocase subunit SecG [Tsuneonella sp. HG222]
MFLFLTVVQAIIAAALVAIVLMQRSEGGGLGIGGGGSPGGIMSARGAADFLTRTTKWLAVLFVGLAIVMAAVAVGATTGNEIDDSLDRTVVPVQGGTDPLTGLAVDPAAPPAAVPAPAEPAPGSDDPLADVAQ